MPWTLSRREFAYRSLASAITTALFLGGCKAPSASPAPGASVQLASTGEVEREPDPTSAFLEAFQRGDETTAERLASPLYQKEWARRRVTAGDRMAWLPASYRNGQSSSTWLDLNYSGGLIDQDGTIHLLYRALTAGGGPKATSSVWRLDTDKAGRVIWAEMVWLFSADNAAVTSYAEKPTATPSVVPPALRNMKPDLVVGVRVSAGWEGYYAVRHNPLNADGTPSFAKPVINFFGIDEFGAIRLAAWSYTAA